ncbi:hypothetical protein [Rufibacter sp. LB8]|uniref:hypothetical protein n=1 Tax=Rufibacter sp. LB8 TaxID=2777781 RepID=UPI00178C6192|nr:hypothetical protein [Rufibacter sp. LB8]
MQAAGKGAEVTEKIPAPGQNPLAPGTAQVILELINVLPLAEPASNGLCNRAEGRVRQVLGLGSSFTETLAPGQVVEVYFTMTLNPDNGWPGAKPGTVLQAEMQAPALNSTLFTVQHYTVALSGAGAEV